MHAQPRPCGDSAALVYLDEYADDRRAALVRALLAAESRQRPPGLLDVVPAHASVLILYDPLEITIEAVGRWVDELDTASQTPPPPRTVEVPVLYGGSAGVDLARLATMGGIGEQEAARLHYSAEYTVYFIGFMPGFPYMGPAPPALRAPRLPTPRTRVPAGSVAVADDMVGIYPSASPGGWNLIGQTPLRLFNPHHDPPSLLQPGDRVRFQPIGADEFREMSWRSEPAG